MKKLIVIMIFFAIIVMSNAMAITISLVPSQEKIHPGDNIFISINISGLHETLPSGNQVNSLLGAFSLDFLYDPSLLEFLGYPPAGWGTYLGNPRTGEAVGNIDQSVPGVISLALVSLLSNSELASLQDNLNSFTLATLGFYAPFGGVPGMPKWPPTWPSGSTVFDTTNIILSDELGNPVPLLDAAGNPILDTNGNPVSAPIAISPLTVAVPEPKTLFLLVFGLLMFFSPLAQRSLRWIGLLAISIYLSISSTTSYAASDIKLLLDNWMDNRWSGQSSQALIEAIHAAGLDISDVEKMLLNGRSQYPDQPDPLGVVVTGKVVTLEHGQLKREGAGTSYELLDSINEYVLYVPKSYSKSVPAPLIIYGHGGDTCMSLDDARANATYAMGAWKAYAERSGSLLVAPLTSRGWGKIGYSILFSVLSQVQRNYNVDPNRIYLNGHSMGGHLAYRSGIYLGDRWAALSPMAGGYDYVATGLVENLFNVRGFAAWGNADQLGLAPINRKLRDWMASHGYLWRHREDVGDHNIFWAFVDDLGDPFPSKQGTAAEFFLGGRRDLYPKEVFGVAGPQDAPGGLNLPHLQIDAVLDILPNGNPGPDWMENDCGDRFIWNPDRPILTSTFSWLELKPLDDASAVQRVWGVNKGGNGLEITSENARQLRVYLHPYMVDFNKPVVIKVNGETVHNALVEPNLATMLDLVRKYDDRGRIFYAAVDINNISTDIKPRSPIGTHIKDLMGDKDDFATGDVADVPVQSPRVAQMLQNLLATGGYTSSVSLDVEATDQLMGWTHRFVLPNNALITSATIKLHLKGNNSLVSNDELLYEETSLDSPFLPFIALQDLNKGIRLTAGQPFELIINLAKTPVRIKCPECAPGANLNPLLTSGTDQNGEYRNLLPLLFDGQFDLVLGDDATVDYSELQITYVLPTAAPGDLDGNGAVDRKDLDILIQAVNTPAYTDRPDPRDLDNDGKITVLDGRKLALLCTKANCAL